MHNIKNNRPMRRQALLRILLFCAALIGTIPVTDASANPLPYPVGEVIATDQAAWSIGAHGKKPLNIGDPVYIGAHIETGNGARLLVLFLDDTEITLGENASLAVDAFLYDPYDAAESHAQFRIAKGAFLFSGGQITRAKRPDVTITTSQGVITAQGSLTLLGGAIVPDYGIYVREGEAHFAGQIAGSITIPKDTGLTLTAHPAETAPLPQAEIWRPERLSEALRRVSFPSRLQEKDIARTLALKKNDNIARRHDYRGQVFSYKENPYRKRLKAPEDRFFSEEFEEMRNR